MFASANSGGRLSVAFPDVCKTPAPPAPFVPVPYPNTQFKANLRRANATDAKANAGNKKAQALRRKAIENLSAATGLEPATLKGMSATRATMIGFVVHKGGV